MRLDQYQVNEEYHIVVLYVFIAEASAVLADRETYAMAAGAVICAGVFGVEGLDGKATFYADWHRIYGCCSSTFGAFDASKHVGIIWFK